MPLRQHENIYVFKEEQGTYNPQMEEGKAYTHKGAVGENYYRQKGKKYNITSIENKGTRHPTSVLEIGEEHENIYVFKKENGTYNPQMEEGKAYTHKGAVGENYYRQKGKKYNITSIENKGTRHPTSVLEIGEEHENIYVFKKENGTYNPQMEEGEPYNSIRNHDGKKEWDNVYKQITKGHINKGTRHPTSILELGEDHENIYVFKKENGTYNPQLEEGEDNKRDWTKTQPRTIGAEIYDKNNNIKHLPKNNNGTRHPTSVLELQEDHENIYVFKEEQGTYNPQMEEGKAYIEKRNNLIKDNVYGGKVKRNKIINKGTRHPTSILEIGEEHENIYVFKKEMKHTIHKWKKENPIILYEITMEKKNGIMFINK